MPITPLTDMLEIIPEHQREPLTRVFTPIVDKTFAAHAIDTVLTRIDRMLPQFTDAYPEPSSVGGVYAPMANTEWTNGFWTGMLWLAFELTGEARYRLAAERQVADFHHRIVNNINVDHHDLGFLYSLSCIASYKLTGNAQAREAALMAAEMLLRRYLPAAGIIQAWGDLNDPEQAGRMIIDCNLNLPLLYWASKETGDNRFRDAADSHIKKAQTFLIRPDFSTFHTFHMDTKTGAPKYGSTHQGYSDSSCWARGQAWGIAGFPLVYRYLRDPSLTASSSNLANYYLNRQPDDLVSCWDLVFTGNTDQRDSSAAAIAVCGLLELAGWLPSDAPDRVCYEHAALGILHSLASNYALAADAPGNGFLAHGVYHMPKNIGVDECCLWGDYFYLEALIRVSRKWEPYW